MKRMNTFWRGLLIVLCLPVMAQAADFVEGTNYQRIVPAQPTETKGKIEVVELFWYGCPHCHRFQPYMERWAKKLPADVEYRRMPAVLAQHWAIHARAFYAAEALGVLEEIHQPLFNAIHSEKRRLDTEERLADFFAGHGVSKEDFSKAFKSFAVDAKLRRAREMSRRYETRATPSVVVNGKYIFSTDNANGNFNTMIRIIDALIEQERLAGSS